MLRSRTNLQEALELFFEAASDSEIVRRHRSEVYVAAFRFQSAHSTKQKRSFFLVLLLAVSYSEQVSGGLGCPPAKAGKCSSVGNTG